MAGPNENMHLSYIGQHFIKLADGVEELAAEKITAAEQAVHVYITRAISQPLFDTLAAFHYHAGFFPAMVVHAVNKADHAMLRKVWMECVSAVDKVTGEIKEFPALVKRRASELQFWAAQEAQSNPAQPAPLEPKAAKMNVKSFILPVVTAASIVALVSVGIAYYAKFEAVTAVPQCPVPPPPAKLECPVVASVPIAPVSSPATKPAPHKKKKQDKPWLTKLFGG